VRQSEPTPETVKGRADKLRLELGNAISRTGNSRLSQLWSDWESRLLHIADESQRRPEVVTAFVGGTGAGKSTLLNAILGVRLLPVNQMLACTAAISEVAYTESPFYSAEIEFVSPEEWKREKENLLGDIAEASGTGDPLDDTQADSETPAKLVREAREKLWAVYRPNEDAEPADFDFHDLEEPPDIARALKRGKELTETSDLKEFRKWIAEYLDSGHRYWPIVKVVRVRGRFPALACGAKLVDLPGLNDPNEARERITRTYLKTCKFVWIIFNIKRLFTRDIWNLMLSADFVRQVVMDGRVGALSFVGTASDDIDLDAGIEQFHLSEDSTEAQVVRARNTEVRKAVARQLREISSRLVSNAGENGSRAEELTSAFLKAGVFTVSAKEYLRIAGLSKTQAVILNSEKDTEIPSLRQHLEKICAEYGVEAHSASLHRQIDVVEDELRRELASQRLRLEQMAETSVAQRKEVHEAAQAAQKFLRTDIADLNERFIQNLESDEEVFRERLKASTQRARYEIGHVLSRWSRMHWATLRAVVRRKGRFVGSTGTHDFPGDLARPILDPIVLAWAEFFGDRLGAALDKWTDRLLLKADQHCNQVAAILTKTVRSEPTDTSEANHISQMTEKILRELLSQTKTEMQQKIDKVRRSLYETVPERIRSEMVPAFDRAANESGPGMKQRIIESLSNHVNHVSQVMFDDSEQMISEGIRQLVDALSRNYREMTEAVDRQVGIVVENAKLFAEGSGTSSAQQQLAVLDLLSDIVSVPSEAQRKFPQPTAGTP